MISTFPSIIRYMSIGARLEELRRSAQMTQQQMADIVGTTKQYVGRLEKGLNQTPNGVFLTGWARHFSVSPRWLSTGEGPRSLTERPSSQAARPDFGKLAASVLVLRHYLDFTGDPPEWISDEVLLETAFEVVEEFGAEVQPGNVFDLTKVLAKRIRGSQDAEGQVRGTRAAAGG
ncbi:helix-turn-helix domain-containing protein [Stenotrophomonas sp. BIGb0135]|uniref:helix-turn-helix domain-containing protein n=1 Tax=Stenotrophomonas sp. BIGb0135 TaxID=2940620 RepID=UPI002167BD88|nr:helix-turn-helix domain-containing protein [Stenotrophomonas sp. BIGb0135]MCS4234444.1 transcriptional regulator with XRE-family HTH domain [Stenotrophomonas sp. BIGb0135]